MAEMFFDDEFPDGGKGVIGYGQAADAYFHDPFMHAQNNVDSNAIMAKPEAPVPQAILVANTSMPNQDRAIKRARDKAYRDRVKKRKMEMEDNLKELTQENKALKDEVGALKDEVRASKAENTRLNHAFQSQGEGMHKLKHDFNQLKHDYIKQNVVV